MKTYIYDRRTGEIVEKPSRDTALVEPLSSSDPHQLWADYMDLMLDCQDIMGGRKPSRFMRKSSGDA